MSHNIPSSHAVRAFVSGDPRGLRATEQHLGRLPVDEIAGSEVKPVVTREGRKYVLKTPAADVLHRKSDPPLPVAGKIGDLPALVRPLVVLVQRVLQSLRILEDDVAEQRIMSGHILMYSVAPHVGLIPCPASIDQKRA